MTELQKALAAKASQWKTSYPDVGRVEVRQGDVIARYAPGVRGKRISFRVPGEGACPEPLPISPETDHRFQGEEGAVLFKDLLMALKGRVGMAQAQATNLKNNDASFAQIVGDL